jgi:hypothetical protein
MLREGEIRQQHTLEALEPQKRDGGPWDARLASIPSC